MSYATAQDFIDYFGESEASELTNLDNPLASQVDQELLEKALSHADAEINGYLAGQYALPIAVTPQVLVYHAMDIARYRLDKYKTREGVTERYERVITYLRDVAKGIVDLGLDKNNKEVTRESVASEPAYVSAPPVFTLSSLRDF